MHYKVTAKGKLLDEDGDAIDLILTKEYTIPKGGSSAKPEESRKYLAVALASTDWSRTFSEGKSLALSEITVEQVEVTDG